MSGRDHFVYRAFDRYGILLYIGVTRCPEQRRQQHSYSSPWYQYATRFQMSGPYDKATGYKVEAAQIQADRPIFNHNAELCDRRAQRDARFRELFPALGIERIDEIGELLDAEFPVQDMRWRNLHYLDERRRRAVRSAS